MHLPGGAIGAETAMTLEACVARIDAIADAALDLRSVVVVLCHGGPIAEPADAAFVLGKAHRCHGSYGASSMERLPAEKAITSQTREFKRISF
jgi:predicted TIM-barrel enzyme